MTTTVSSKGQVVLPAEIREQDDIRPGQTFLIERIERGQYRLVRQEAGTNVGLVDLLLRCPVKGFFVPIESESTDTI
jgi:AbrB family looped-hinge helix DNA binding protein